jgi:Spy/CpxP family protein refolding chaperone
MRRTWTLALAATLLSGALATTAGAQSPPAGTQPPTPGQYQQKMMERIQQRLGLRDDQMPTFQAAWDRQRAAAKQLWPTVRQTQIELRQLALNNGDPVSIENKAAQLQQQLGQLMHLRIQMLQELAPHLDADQKAKLAQLGAAGGWHRGPRQPRPS